MRRLATAAACALLLATAAGCMGDRPDALRIGAVYPLSGSQGPGGVSEYRGVRTAVELVNRHGGVDGRRVALVPVNVPGAAAVPAAVSDLRSRGVRIVLGSYGSTISVPAARLTAASGMLFWENGAVGEPGMDSAVRGAHERGRLAFRVAPTGMTLGRAAIDFVTGRYAALRHISPSRMRVAVAYVDDVYGRSVARGALARLHRSGVPVAGRFPYDPRRLSPRLLALQIRRSGANVVFAAAYLRDGVALRRALVAEHVRLLTAIGTSSSYCMPAFGRALGREAVGLFASDKPDAWSLPPSALAPEARAALREGRELYERRYGGYMDAPALAGFAGAWALLHDVLPRARGTDPAAVARAARRIDLPVGSLPNGSGLRFGPGTGGMDNRRARSVIWEWIAPRHRVIVWPPRFATHSVRVLEPMP